MNAQLRPSELIAHQQDIIREQAAIIDVLKGALAADSVDSGPAFQPWMHGLTPQERALLGALYRRYPAPVSRYELLELLPGFDHVVERQPQLVSVKVSHVRRKLGPDAIVSVRGAGYSLGPRQHKAMRCRDARRGA